MVGRRCPRSAIDHAAASPASRRERDEHPIGHANTRAAHRDSGTSAGPSYVDGAAYRGAADSDPHTGAGRADRDRGTAHAHADNGTAAYACTDGNLQLRLLAGGRRLLCCFDCMTAEFMAHGRQ